MGAFYIDEAASRDPKHPSHDHTWAMAFAVAFLVWIAGLVVFSSFVETSFSNSFLAIAVFFFGVFAGITFGALWSLIRRKSAARAASEFRATQEAETQRKLEEARKNGIF